MDPANTAYRIESKLKLTVYEGISDDLTEDNCSNEKLRKHCNLVPVVPLDCDLHEPLPVIQSPFNEIHNLINYAQLGTIVAIKESTSYNRVVLPQGELFVITSKPKTPRVCAAYQWHFLDLTLFIHCRARPFDLDIQSLVLCMM